MCSFEKTKLKGCIRLARECSRNSWQLLQNENKKHAREYLNIKRQAIADARYWKAELEKCEGAKHD